MSARLLRLDGADAWARLKPGVRDAIGRFAVEMMASELWNDVHREAGASLDDPADVRLARQLLIARNAALEGMRRVAFQALPRAGVDPVQPMLPWAAGRACASCGRVEAEDPRGGWIGAERCEHCPPQADPC